MRNEKYRWFGMGIYPKAKLLIKIWFLVPDCELFRAELSKRSALARGPALILCGNGKPIKVKSI